jgi:hypothetical protein
MPSSILRSLKLFQRGFEEDVRVDRTVEVRGPHLRNGSTYHTDAKAALLNMLKAMMAFKPGDWTTATKQIIESEWMEKWALPELSRLKEAEGA